MISRIVTIAAALLLSACAPEFTPPPDYNGGFLWESDISRTVTVAPGDTLATISRRYDAPSQVIIARNGLTAPYALTPGQELILDPTRSHKVVAGDTLSQLAVTYGVEMRLIAAANNLSSPYVIRVGQDLWIPDPFSAAAAPVGPVVAELAPPPPVAALARAPRSAIRTESLAPVQGPPIGATDLPPAQPAPTAPAPVVSTPPEQPLTPPPVASAPPSTPVVQPEEEVAVAVPPQPLTEPAARAGARFSWPLRGRLVANFGAAGKGLHNDGINIAAPTGTQVRAADNGVVAYAGNELKGFGNLLLIKHADGWTTAYAHNEKLLVKRGDVVQQGQVIAAVGHTGNVDAPQLHFEVRKGTQAVNPLEYLAQ